jgi:2-oxoacid:acceptor oxidoreductase gamma subunit (pyruvate/2-ketoisovalerate family)
MGGSRSEVVDGLTEVRFHGRGGQGTVVASEALAKALAREEKWVQTFPEYGVERRGAPVTAFTRISKGRIYLRCKIYEPDHVVILDPTLIDAVDVTAGLKDGGYIIVNTTKKPSELKFPAKYKVRTIDATGIALKHGLGSQAAPIVNTAILGAFSKITGLVGIEALVEAIKEKAPIKKEENMQAAREAYEEAKS